jgi:uncharacterized repeat protein (TIGR01451 family)
VRIAGLSLVVLALAAGFALAQAPAITLSKTVGTTAGVCAATNAVTVSTGTDVYYCFQATNTGSVTFNFHDLVDDHLGVLLDNFSYTLAPGATSPQVIVPDTATATVTNTATWTAVDALGGYTIDDTIAYNWEDIAATGTAVALTDDSTATFPIGFTFDFYGVSYTDFWISSNGFLQYSNGGSGCCTGQNLPNTATPNGVIAGWWEDLNLSGGGTVHYQTLGTAPNRYTIVQFTAVPHYSTGNNVTMQFKLFETTDVIEVHYQAAPSDGGTHTAGIENQDGTVAALYYNGTAALTTPEALRYTPTVAQQASAVATASVTIADPDITVNPTSLASTQATNQVVTQPFEIGNVGVIPLDWTLDEEPAARNFPPMPRPAGHGTPADAAEQVGDVPAGKIPEWFPARADWSRPAVVLYDNGPLVTHPGGGGGGLDASALQTALLMSTYGFGAQVSAGNRVADDFTVTDAAGWTINTITFFGYQTGSGNTSTFTALNLRIWDGPPNVAGSTVIWGDTTTNVMTSTTFSNIYRVLDTALTNVDRPVMACVATVGTTLPAGTYWLDWQLDGSGASGPWAPPISILGQTTTGNALQYTTTGGWASLIDTGSNTVQGLPFVVDGDLAICGNLADIPWLSTSPITGTIAAGGLQPVDVTFDSTGLADGLYEGNLCVFSNDPDEPVIAVPVALTVTQVQASADLSITKTATPPTVPVGGNLTFNIGVANAGPDAATNVVVTDNIPAGLTVVSATPSQGGPCTGIGVGPTTVNCPLGTINAAGAATVVIVATATAAGPIVNTAAVTSAITDPTPANNTATATASAAAAEIPTLGTWGLVGFGLILALAGLAFLTRMRLLG